MFTDEELKTVHSIFDSYIVQLHNNEEKVEATDALLLKSKILKVASAYEEMRTTLSALKALLRNV